MSDSLTRRKRTVASYTFKVELEQDLDDRDQRWSAWIGALPGCTAWGYSEQEAQQALTNMAVAYIADMVQSREEIPEEEADVRDSRFITITITTNTTVTSTLSPVSAD